MCKIWLLPAAVLLVAGAASAAETGADSTAAVMSECSAPPQASLDSCLERVRILEETDSAPGLASLEARLETRIAADHEPVGPPPAGRAAVEVRPYATTSAAISAGRDSRPADEADQTATAAPRSLQEEEPMPVVPGDVATDSAEDDSAVPDAVTPPAAADDTPPYISPDDEPPIADPPDADTAPPDRRRRRPAG
jgi:hypothetical protein